MRYNDGTTDQDRINKRLLNSGVGRGTMPDATVHKGVGPTRTVTNVHHAGGHHGTDQNPSMGLPEEGGGGRGDMISGFGPDSPGVRR